MSTTHDDQGREYAKLSETKVGDTLIADGAFTCMKAGPHIVKTNDDGLYVDCDEGGHQLDGQCDDGDHIIGFIRSET